MTKELTRADLLRRAAAGAAAVAVPGAFTGLARASTGGLGKSLTISNWPLYIDIDAKTKRRPTIDQFAKKYGVQVTYNEDINIFKVFPIKERLNLRFEGQFGNIFNRTDFCDPNGFYGPGSFGTVNTQCNQPRSIQFGLRLNY